MTALRPFGLEVKATEGYYHARSTSRSTRRRPIVLTERGDTVTENALMAAALHRARRLRNAAQLHGPGPLLLPAELGVGSRASARPPSRHRRGEIDVDVDYAPAEDPIEAMCLLAAAIVTSRRSPSSACHRVPRDRTCNSRRDGLELLPPESTSPVNGHTRLVDLTTHRSQLRSPSTRSIRCRSQGSISTTCRSSRYRSDGRGQTLIHDWVYENRAIYLIELNRLGARVQLLDPHRVIVEGPTRWPGTRSSAPRRSARRW